MRRFFGSLMALGATVVLGSGAAQAQNTELFFYGSGGANSPLTDLNDAGTAQFGTEFAVSGGAGVTFGRYFGVRGDFTWSQATGEGGSTGFNGADFNRFQYGGEVFVRYPFAGGFAPFLGVGGGAVTVDPDGPGTALADSFTKGAGRASIGLEYVIPRTGGLGLLAQATGWLYDFDRAGFDKSQFDLIYTGGLSYRFRL